MEKAQPLIPVPFVIKIYCL